MRKCSKTQNTLDLSYFSLLSSPTELFMKSQSWSAYSTKSFRKPEKLFTNCKRLSTNFTLTFKNQTSAKWIQESNPLETDIKKPSNTPNLQAHTKTLQKSPHNCKSNTHTTTHPNILNFIHKNTQTFVQSVKVHFRKE